MHQLVIGKKKSKTAEYSTIILLLLLLSHFSSVRLCVTHRWQPTRLPCPWDSLGKNTRVGCHFLLQCMKSEVAQSCPTLSNPTDCSLPGSSVHGIFQARVLEWGAIAFSELLFYFSSNRRKLLFVLSHVNNSTSRKQTDFLNALTL